MIRTDRCIICGTRRLRRSPGGVAPFLAHRCGIDPATVPDRVWCPACDLLFFDHRLDDAEVLRLYTGYRNEQYVEERTRFEPSYPARHPQCVDVQHELQQSRIRGLALDFAAMDRPLGRVLDFGGGDGWLTRNAFPGGDITVYDLEDGGGQPPVGPFDLVVCAHVLEHVSFPRTFLNQVKTFVRPGGMLYLEVPGPGQRPPGSEVFDYMGPVMHEHVSYFSGRSLLRLLHRCRLEPLHVVTVKEVTKVFAQPIRPWRRPLPWTWFRPSRMVAPVRGPQGSDSLGLAGS